MKMNLFEQILCPNYASGQCNGKLAYQCNNENENIVPYLEYPQCKRFCSTIKKFAVDLVANPDLNLNRALSSIKCHETDQNVFKRYREIKDDICNYVKNGNNLYITSNNYKNNLSIISQKLLMAYLWCTGCLYIEALSVLYIYVPSFLIELDSFSYRNSVEFTTKIKTLEKVDLVVWDYINLSPIKGKSLDITNSIIQKRFNNNKSNIFTGYEISNLEDVVGPFLMQKLNSCENIKISKLLKIKEFDIKKITPKTPFKLEIEDKKIED